MERGDLMTRLSIITLMSLVFALAVLGQPSDVRLEGQVVCCAECWAGADRTKVEFGTAERSLES